jgi:hypothetical protein
MTSKSFLFIDVYAIYVMYTYLKNYMLVVMCLWNVNKNSRSKMEE